MSHSILFDHGTSEYALGHSIAPAFTKSSALEGLEAASGSTAGESVGHTVSKLVNDDIVLHGAVAVRGRERPDEHIASAGLATKHNQ